MAKRRPGPTTITSVDTDYTNRPKHRGHTVEIQGWNEEYVLLLITSDSKSGEAIITPDQLLDLATQAKAEAKHW